jgi:hypothetical protein
MSSTYLEFDSLKCLKKRLYNCLILGDKIHGLKLLLRIHLYGGLCLHYEFLLSSMVRGPYIYTKATKLDHAMNGTSF